MYAVVETGGKQYRVKAGDVIDVEHLVGEIGSTIRLDNIRLVELDGQVIAGSPVVPGAQVAAQVEAQLKGPKIIVGKYKAKTRYRRKNGHRQSYSRLRISEVIPHEDWNAPKPLAEKQEAEAQAEKSARPRRRQVRKDGT
ncbi:MAG: 50S ribosomal protein L21 [Chloroflexi bacterium]|nr:50S ribosomal protein L21 [Chloroflexota bacterium]